MAVSTTPLPAHPGESAPGPPVDERATSGSAGTRSAIVAESRPWHARSLHRFAVLALVAGLYYLAGKFGLTLAFVHPSATPVWPPTGITLAALLWLGYRAWPGIFVGAFLVNVTTAGSIATSLGIASGNTLEGLLGAYLVNRFAHGRRAFERARDTFRFAVLAGVVSTVVSATLGVTSLAVGGFARWADVGPIWLTWWLGDMGGDLVVAPMLVLWSRGHLLRWRRMQVLEAVILVVSLLAVGVAVFGPFVPLGGRGYPLEFVCMPLLIWAAFRFDQRTAATATFLLSAIAVWGTLAGDGPFGTWERNEALLLLQVFMGVTAVATLALAATVAEQRRGEERVRAVSDELREALAELEAFSHSISHDLRSPIGAVLNYSEIIEQDYRGRIDEEGMRLLRRIQTSAGSAARLLDQLVHFAWVGPGEGEKQDVEMTSLAREAYAEVATASGDSGNVRFETWPLPGARGNRPLLGRVFSNLFSNAVKFTRERADPRIEVSGEAGERENTYCVTDNGVGFDPGLGDALFQPFRRVNRGREVEGSGLGLAIVAKIIRRHGGRVWAESDGATGARFCFTLPNTKRSP